MPLYRSSKSLISSPGGFTPLAVACDVKGNLRLYDCRLGRKLTRLVNACPPNTPPTALVSSPNVFAVISPTAEEHAQTASTLAIISMEEVVSSLFPGIQSRVNGEITGCKLFRLLNSEQRTVRAEVAQKQDAEAV